jgi:hypothetical protein
MVLSAASCYVNPPISGRQDPYAPQQIYFASADLANKTAVDAPRMERKNGILYVTVPIRSAVDQDLLIDYQVTFLNAQGVPIDPGPWTHLQAMLVRNTPQYIQFNSMSGDAVDFRLSLRYAE